MSLLATWGVGAQEGAESGSEAVEPPLPEQIGAINDYAASLGRESRHTLRRHIEALAAEAVEVVLLITLLDPFSDSPRMSQAIWNRWGLSSNSLLLLFVREGDRWVFEQRTGEELPRRPLGDEARREIRALLDDRRIASAAIRAVEGVAEAFEIGTLGAEERSPPGREPSGQATPGEDEGQSRAFWKRPLFWGLLGGLGGVALVWGAIRFALTWLCPRCGARMQRQTVGRRIQPLAQARPRASRGGRGRAGGRKRSRTLVYYYCQRCGYRRSSRGEG